MGRNPAGGRQGPRLHAAVIPSEDKVKALEVTQIRSTSGQPETMRRTREALGLHRHQRTVRLANTASARGMLFKVRHLVDVKPA
jgi:large subunit ribosomal protein L30